MTRRLLNEIYEVVCQDCPLSHIPIKTHNLDPNAQDLLSKHYDEDEPIGEVEMPCEYDGDCNAIRVLYELVLQGKLDLRDLRKFVGR